MPNFVFIIIIIIAVMIIVSMYLSRKYKLDECRP